MSDVAFVCPHCSASLSVDAELAGMRVECPACGNELETPASSLAELSGDSARVGGSTVPSAQSSLGKEVLPRVSPADFRRLLELASADAILKIDEASKSTRLILGL